LQKRPKNGALGDLIYVTVLSAYYHLAWTLDSSQRWILGSTGWLAEAGKLVQIVAPIRPSATFVFVRVRSPSAESKNRGTKQRAKLISPCARTRNNPTPS